jgi:hypothetical protein
LDFGFWIGIGFVMESWVQSAVRRVIARLENAGARPVAGNGKNPKSKIQNPK